jgi:hypothetical protein
MSASHRSVACLVCLVCVAAAMVGCSGSGTARSTPARHDVSRDHFEQRPRRTSVIEIGPPLAPGESRAGAVPPVLDLRPTPRTSGSKEPKR